MIGIASAVLLVCMEMSVLSPIAMAAAVAQAETAETETVDRMDPTDPAPAFEAVSAPEELMAPLVFEDKPDDEVVDLVLGYIEGIGTLQGGFTQIAPSGAVSTGKFYLRRPGQLRFEYDEPSPLLIVATQGNVYIWDEALETTDFYPISKTPLKFLLSKKIDFGDAEVVSVDRGIDTVAVTFASEAEETEGELSLIVSAPEMSLRQWIVRDLQSGSTIVTLDNVVAGGKLPNRLFRAPEAGGKFINN